MSDNAPEVVDLDPAATDAIAAKVNASEPEWAKALRAELAETKAMLNQPQRTETVADGVQPKGNDHAPIYGGDDKYTLVGDSDADVAVNLYLTGEFLKATGKKLSPRAQQVMVATAERAIKAGAQPRDFKSQRDHAAFLKMQNALDRADVIKAMTSTSSGNGDEWVPTFATSELWVDTHLATRVASQIRRVDMPTNPYDLPTQTADATFYYASSENTAVTASNPTTSKATLTAKKIQAEIDFSGEVTEDSIIPVVPALRANLVRRGAQVIDDLIVHGDTETAGTGNVNSDDAAPSASSFYLALSGMRKFCLVTNTGQVKSFAGAPTTTLYLNTRSKLGRYGAMPSDLICVMPPTTSYAFQDVAGFKLAYEFGPQATVLTGQLGAIFGTPVIASEAIPGTSVDVTDADGKYTTTSPSSNDTKGWFVLFNVNHWVAGFRRGFQIESFRDIQKDQNILVASFRMGLIPSGISTAHTAVGYNITV